MKTENLPKVQTERRAISNLRLRAKEDRHLILQKKVRNGRQADERPGRGWGQGRPLTWRDRGMRREARRRGVARLLHRAPRNVQSGRGSAGARVRRLAGPGRTREASSGEVGDREYRVARPSSFTFYGATRAS